MRFLHYSEFPVNRVLDGAQYDNPARKPCGLWISDEDDYGWHQWTQKNAPDFLRKENVYEVIVELDNLLWLKTPEDIEAFTFCYSVEDFGLPHIDWPVVAKEYDGIIITPYQWTCRLSIQTMWYYGWDCASGCIWNKKAIKRIIPVNSV